MNGSDAEFGRLTFRQIDSLIRRVDHRERRMDERFAVLDCILANQWREEGSEPYTPEDFMPVRQPTTDVNKSLVEWLRFQSNWAERRAKEAGAKMQN